jgi:hypothetical protein
LVLTSISCCKATPFSRRGPILLGSYRVTVLRVEAEESSQGNLDLSVFFDLEQVESAEGRGGLLGGNQPKAPNFTIVDSQGKSFGPRLIDYGQGGETSVIIFTLPADSRGLTAMLHNPRPHKGQPCAAAVPLGR